MIALARYQYGLLLYDYIADTGNKKALPKVRLFLEKGLFTYNNLNIFQLRS